MKNTTKIIRHRRSIYPDNYSDKEISRELLEEMLENANWAPTHRKTEPWRFVVYHSLESRQALSRFLQDQYDHSTNSESFSPFKHKKIGKKPIQSACMLAIIMQRDPDERLPEWEEIAALSMAVQNLWLTAAAHGIGGYWSTPGFIKQPEKFFDLKAGQQFKGLFYMGYPSEEWPESKRSPIDEKTTWL